MISRLLAWVSAGIVACISFLGYPGVIFLMLIESACIPVPSEIIMPFSGYLAGIGRFSLLGVVFAGSLGNLFGATIIYFIVKNKGRAAIEKYGRYILFSPHHLEKADLFFGKYGNISVFIGRMLPVVRTFISLPAGITRVPLIPFWLLTFLGSFLWCFWLAYVGMILGRNWGIVSPYFHRADFPIVILLMGGVGLWIWKNRN